MADLAALLLLLASGWWDGVLRRLGTTRGRALAAGALILAAGDLNVGLGGAAAARVNLGGALPAVVMLALAWARPATGGRLLAASGAAASLLFGLGGWSGPVAALGLPLMAAAASGLVAGAGPTGLLAAAAAPALADVAHWLVAYADGLPGTVWIGGGASFATMVLSVAAAGIALAACARGKHVSR
jgi:hypothetical protein